jgi:alginate O-acetyltransferase complex protein AlgJ
MTQAEAGTQGPAGLFPAEIYYGDEKVIRGKNGWLFLAKDSNDVLAQHTGGARLSEAQLEQWRYVLETRTAWLERQGIPYVFMVAPNGHSVYPENLPDSVQSAAERPVMQLTRYLEESGSFARILYPVPELTAHKARAPVYQKTDTHWNDIGAFIAYDRIAQELDGRVAMRRLSLDDFELRDQALAGDLGHKLFPPEASPRTLGFHKSPSAVLESDNCVHGSGTVLRLRSGEAPSHCMMFGDSFAYYLLNFFAESFARFTFVHLRKLDHEVVWRYRPDAVVTVLTERFLMMVPQDLIAPSQRRMESERRGKGQVRFPFTQWRHAPEADPGPLSPESIERMRAHLVRDGRLGDATLLCMLAYAGLRPKQALRLTWGDVGEEVLSVAPWVPDANGDDPPSPARDVPLLAPLAEDLEEWRRASGDPGADQPIFPGPSGGTWAEGEWLSWCEEALAPTVRAVGADGVTPRNLRDCYWSLLLREGWTIGEVCRVTGDDPWTRYATLVFVADDAARGERIDPAEEIARARRRQARSTAEPS